MGFVCCYNCKDICICGLNWNKYSEQYLMALIKKLSDILHEKRVVSGIDEKEPIQLPEDLKNHEGEWVILSHDRKSIIVAGKQFADVAPRAHEGIIWQVPRSDSAYAL